MTIKSWNEFKKGGFVMLSYPFLQSLEVITAIVLCQLMAEYNHATNKKLNVGTRFLVNLKRMSDYLNFDKEEIITALQDLQNLGLIAFCTAGIEDTFLIWVKENNIIEFKQQKEQENVFHDWDWGLINCQNPRGAKTTFNKLTNALIQFINNNMKHPETIPMAVYAQCNLIFEEYENYFDCLFKEIFNYEDVLNCINSIDFQPINLAFLVQNKCKERKENEHV